MSIISRLLPLVFSANFLNSVVRVSTPLILCAMAACIGKQANVQTITYEGMMLLAAFAGNLGTSYAKSLAGGIIIGLLASLAIAVFYGFFNIYLDTYDTLLGIAVNNFVSFFTIFMLFVLIGRKSDSSTIPSFTYPIVNIPLINKIPIIGTIFTGQSLVTYIAIISVFVAHFIVYKSRLGLRIRSVGRSPEAAESLGIDVKKTKMIALVLSGLFAGIAGEYMSMKTSVRSAVCPDVCGIAGSGQPAADASVAVSVRQHAPVYRNHHRSVHYRQCRAEKREVRWKGERG